MILAPAEAFQCLRSSVLLPGLWALCAENQRIHHRVHRGHRTSMMSATFTLRNYEPHDFAAIHRLDQACFPSGISYSKTTLKYFLSLRSADCIVAIENDRIAAFILTEENPPLAHIITLDVAEAIRRRGVGTLLLQESERNLILRGVRHVLLETAIENSAAVAFWQRHGYRIEAVLKRYYLGRLDAYEMRKILPKTNQTSATPSGGSH